MSNDVYGDGTVFRGVRSEDSNTPTYSWHDLARAKGVPCIVTNAMLIFEQKHIALVEKCAALEAANKDLQDWFDALKIDRAKDAADAEAWRNFKARTLVIKARKSD